MSREIERAIDTLLYEDRSRPVRSRRSQLNEESVWAELLRRSGLSDVLKELSYIHTAKSIDTDYVEPVLDAIATIKDTWKNMKERVKKAKSEDNRPE